MRSGTNSEDLDHIVDRLSAGRRSVYLASLLVDTKSYNELITYQEDQAVISLQPLVALVAGILILIIPRLLNYIVAVYLIIVGVLGLLR